MKGSTVISFALTFCLATPSIAGGLLGDAISAVGNVVAPGSNIGKPLDDLNRNIKNNVPIYGTVEEGASAAVRNISRESLVETAGPVLAEMIQVSKNDTLRGGVQDIPPYIRNVMTQFYGSDVAAGIRFRVGNGGDLALASNAFRYGDAIAITLDDLIVFSSGQVAQDLSVWAHELQHVQQFRNWGVLDFSKRYVRDHQAVENEAYATQDRFRAWAQSSNSSGNQLNISNVSMPPPAQLSGVCATPAGMCVIPGMVPVGMGCWCGTMGGPINGQIVSQ